MVNDFLLKQGKKKRYVVIVSYTLVGANAYLE